LRDLTIPAGYAAAGLTQSHRKLESGVDVRNRRESERRQQSRENQLRCKQRRPIVAYERDKNAITLFIMVVLLAMGATVGTATSPILGASFFVIAFIVLASLKLANTWQKVVILRAGKLQGVKGQGLFLIILVIDSVAAVIDERIQTTAFNAEQALTKDSVPVNVDAIIFWHVHDARKAALDITNYREAIDRVAQTSLREMIGSLMLASLLADRKAAEERLRDAIGLKTSTWGVT
jgi:regulator of protease activity HflC (stomatin/prohibitin superfamily)